MQSESMHPEEKKIRDLVQEWVEAANRKDVEAVLKFYRSDATLVWPGEPAKQKGDIEKALRKMLGDAFIRLNFEPENITIAQNADMASDFGRFTYEYNDDKGPHKLVEKYLVVWRKSDDGWKVFYDCYNSNEPPA